MNDWEDNPHCRWNRAWNECCDGCSARDDTGRRNSRYATNADPAGNAGGPVDRRFGNSSDSGEPCRPCNISRTVVATDQ